MIEHDELQLLQAKITKLYDMCIIEEFRNNQTLGLLMRALKRHKKYNRITNNQTTEVATDGNSL